MSGFIFCGTTSESLGLRVLTKRFPLLPERVTLTEEIAGRNGVLDYSLSPIHGYPGYRERVIELECAFISREPLLTLVQQLRSFMPLFLQKGSLVLYDDADVSYVGYVQNTADLERELYTVGRFTLSFRCEPFGYGKQKTTSITWNASGYSLPEIVAGCYPVWPVFKFTEVHAGFIFGIGDRSITFPSAATSVTLDCGAMKVTDSSGNRITGCSGEFPFFLPGRNGMRATFDTEALEKITATYYYTPLYL